jgi:hypothetical protein
MLRTQSRWLVVAIALLLVTPAGIVAAQDTNETNETDDGDEFEDGNETEANESADEDEGEAEDKRADDRGRQPAMDKGPETDWREDNGTYTGEFLQVTVDEELPGLADVTYLDPNATVFASVQLEGEEFEHRAHGHVLVGETDENEFTVRDEDGGHLVLEGDGDAPLTLDVAAGVDVNESQQWSDDEDSAYELSLAENQTVWLYGEVLSFDNGTFSVGDDARLSPEFPPAQREDKRPEREPPRETGSQWDRDNQTFQGDHVSFTYEEGAAAIHAYAVDGDVVFADASLAEGEQTDWRAHGKHFEIRQDDARLRVVDIPPAVLEIRGNEEAAAHLSVADGVTVEQVDRYDDEDENETDDNETDEAEDRRIYEVSFADNRTGWLAGEDLNVTADRIEVHDKALFRVMPTDPEASANKGPGSMPDEAGDREAEDDEEREAERGPPEDRGAEGESGPPARAHPMSDEARTKVEQAKAAGQVAAEVHVGADESPVAVETGPVQVNDTWVEAGDEVRAGMQIEAPDDTPGTTVTMNLDEAGLEGVNVTDVADELSVRYDNETIDVADDLDDVLDPTDDEGEPEYLVMVGGDGAQVLVSVPHFSPHTIEVYQTQSSSEQLDGSQVPGFTTVGMILATGLAGLAAARHRR